MKKLISDLLDCYGEEKIRLKKAPAVSTDRIYALANTKAGKENVFMEKRHNRRLPVILTVVVAIVLLMGAGFVVAHDSITDYFVRQWEGMTDTEITEEHLATLESFTQEIGLTQSSDGVTITVDSAAVGGDTLYVLFAVECDSVEFATTRSPSFDEFRWNITNSSATVQGGGLRWGGTDENNVTYFVLEGNLDICDESSPIAVSVHLAGLHTNRGSTHEEYPDVYLGGEWDFEFTLEQNTLNPLSLLDDGERKTVTITMYDTKSTEATHSLVLKDVTVDVTSAVVTEFGITITFDDTTASVPFGTYSDRFEVYAIMQDGSEITVNSCSGSDDGTATDDITLKYLWYSVIDLSELKAVRIGDTEFYVNPEEAPESAVQEIGISETQGQDMTVTVDSVTFTDERLYALIKVEGCSEEQPLLDYDVNIYGDFADNSSCNVIYDGIHEDGATYYVANLVYNYVGEPDATEVDVTLVIENPDDENAQSWQFSFTLERTSSNKIDVISGDDEPITVTVSMESLLNSLLAGEAIYQDITRDVIAVTLFESGMYVTYDNETAIVPDGVDQYDIDSIYWDTNAVFAVMQDGTTVPVNYTTYTPIEGSTTATVEYLWLIPIDLEDVAYIRIGDTDIEVG